MNLGTLARCERVQQEAGGVKVFTLRAQNASAALMNTLKPGRHVAVRCPDASGTPQERLYSVTRKEAPDLFEISVKCSGRGGISDQLHQIFREGASLPIQYTAGDITVESVIGHRRVAMIAGGIGITLPIALIRELAILSRNGMPIPDVVLLLCIPRVSEIPFLHELLELDLTTSWFTFRVFVTRETVHAGDHFQSGRPTEESLEFFSQPEAVVIAGSHAFAQCFRDLLGRRFLDAKFFIESFTPPLLSDIKDSQPGENYGLVRLHIADGGRMLEAPPGKSLLELLESMNIPIRNQCRSGICGSCRVKVLGGKCKFETDFCLDEEDKSNGYALSCCTFPLAGDVTIYLGQAI